MHQIARSRPKDRLLPSCTLGRLFPLQRFYPECRIILISGNPDSFELHSRARMGGHDFLLLAKPVPPERLLDEVAEILSDHERVA